MGVVLDPLLVSAVLDWGVASAAAVAILALVALGLNVQWGYAGILNLGVAAFFMVGAYTSALLTLGPPAAPSDYVGGFGLPIPAGWIAALLAGGLLGWGLGSAARGLRGEVAAAVTLALAFALRGMADTIEGFVNRGRGVEAIPQLFAGLAGGAADPWMQLLLALAVLGVTYQLVRRATGSPWGRVLRALRDQEASTAAAGRNVEAFRLQAFALGGAVMALAGALWAQRSGSIRPADFDDVFGTLLVWAMVLVGGSGNHRGALLGAALVGALWFATPELAGRLPASLAPQAAPMRNFAVGLVIVLVVLARPQGVLAEEPRVSRYLPSHGPPERGSNTLLRWLRAVRP
jgi:branched-chain amino acid transport system permease protein